MVVCSWYTTPDAPEHHTINQEVQRKTGKTREKRETARQAGLTERNCPRRKTPSCGAGFGITFMLGEMKPERSVRSVSSSTAVVQYAVRLKGWLVILEASKCVGWLLTCLGYNNPITSMLGEFLLIYFQRHSTYFR